MTFGERLTAARKAKGLTQTDVGEMVGQKGGIISRYENDINTPSIEVAAKLASKLGVTLDYLVTGESPDSRNVADESIKEYVNLFGALPEKEKGLVKSIIEAFADGVKFKNLYNK